MQYASLTVNYSKMNFLSSPRIERNKHRVVYKETLKKLRTYIYFTRLTPINQINSLKPGYPTRGPRAACDPALQYVCPNIKSLNFLKTYI